jgi:hypothetical protein
MNQNQIKKLGKILESKRNSEEFNFITNGAIDSFFDFFDENEIIFEEEIVILVTQLRDYFDKVRIKQTFDTMWESSRGFNSMGKSKG